MYLAIAELRRRGDDAAQPGSRDLTHSLDLTPYELKVFSQNGEDGVLDEILRRVGLERRLFVEFGAGTGAEGVCVYLADVAGWKGRLIEADPTQFELLAPKYSMSSRVTAACAAITPENVESVFERLDVPETFDVLSIDIDGHDYWVWRAIEHYRPRVVVVEYNAHLGTEPLTMPLEVERAWDGTDYFGASITALRGLASEKGYELVHCDLSGVNAFFVRGELVGDRFLAPPEVVLRAPNYKLQGRRHRPGGGRWVRVQPGPSQP
ncbi:MAG TPA: hypothetical protein VGL51_10780 [Solirubrobacteraceae bacterium]